MCIYIPQDPTEWQRESSLILNRETMICLSEKMIRKLDLEKNVSFLGALDEEKMCEPSFSVLMCLSALLP